MNQPDEREWTIETLSAGPAFRGRIDVVPKARALAAETALAEANLAEHRAIEWAEELCEKRRVDQRELQKLREALKTLANPNPTEHENSAYVRRMADYARAALGDTGNTPPEEDEPLQRGDYEYRLSWQRPGVACVMAHAEVAWESLTDEEWEGLPWAEDHYEPVRNVRFERRLRRLPDEGWSEVAVRGGTGVTSWKPVSPTSEKR